MGANRRWGCVVTAPAVFEWVRRPVEDLGVGNMIRMSSLRPVKESRVGPIERFSLPSGSLVGSIVVAGDRYECRRGETVERWEQVENPPVLWCFYHWRQAVAEMTDDPFECGTFLVDCDIDEIEILRSFHGKRS